MEDKLLLTDDSVRSIGAKSRYNVVKLGFGGRYIYKHTNKKNIMLQVLVGFGISKKLGWETGDYISIDHVGKSLILKKIDEDKNNDSEYKLFKGYKFKRVNNSYSHDLSLTCNFMLPPARKRTRTVRHEIIKNGNDKALKVFLDTYYPNDEGKDNDKK